MLCVGGNVGKYFESLCVGASPDKAGQGYQLLYEVFISVKLTDFDRIRWKMVNNRILQGEVSETPLG